MNASSIETHGICLNADVGQEASSEQHTRTAAIVLTEGGRKGSAQATLLELAAMDQPLAHVLVIDGGTQPSFWEPVASLCAKLGPRFRFFHLGDGSVDQHRAVTFAYGELPAGVRDVWLVRPGSSLSSHEIRPASLPPAATTPTLARRIAARLSRALL